MIKLIRYYRPWMGAILLSLVFLFAQVNLDLALPDYLSRIINIGIQQSGIESPIPSIISSQTWNALSESAPDGGQGLVDLFEGTRGADGEELFVAVENIEQILAEDQELRTEFLRTFLASGEGDSPGSQDISTAQLPVLEQLAIERIRQENNRLGIDPASVQNAFIFRTGAFMIGLTVLSALATIMVSYLGARVSAGMARSLRSDVFSTVEGFSAAEVDRFSTASLITRSTNDITQVQTVTFLIIRMVFMAPLMGIGGIIRAVGKAPSMAWLIGLAVLILLVLVIVVIALIIPRYQKIQKLTDKLNRISREHLNGLMVVRAFNRQNFERDRFDDANRELTDTNLFVMRMGAAMMPLIMLVMNVLTVAIVWVGAEQVAASTLPIGDMLAFLQYAIRIVWSFLMLTMIFVMVPRASVSAKRIAEVLNTEATIIDPVNPVEPAITTSHGSSPKPGPGILEFRDVCFSYPGADEHALRGISFTARPGTTTAIIGSTGAGKTSLLNLIPRFYDAGKGSILLDGVDIREMTQEGLRNQIGYVPQTASLFTGTIGSNLRFGDESADDQLLTQALEVAQALGFVDEREGGLEAEVSQSGTNVSGGQRQRLSIARALVKKPSILIFDDSFSALDFKTDAALRRALDTYAADTTRIVVAQRVSTILGADQIIVLEDGQITGLGKHKELMDSCTEYREIVLSQLSVEEAS